MHCFDCDGCVGSVAMRARFCWAEKNDGGGEKIHYLKKMNEDNEFDFSNHFLVYFLR